jgi:hypothetical protein
MKKLHDTIIKAMERFLVQMRLQKNKFNKGVLHEESQFK